VEIPWGLSLEIFFIIDEMKVSIPLILEAVGVFISIFAVGQIFKFGVYAVSKHFLEEGTVYTTLMMSTDLTFGLVACLFGLNAGLIGQSIYSVLTGVLILSAVLPSFVAQKWFMPIHSEDLSDH
jgi:Kef-type K+ transport system membrane component KefB